LFQTGSFSSSSSDDSDSDSDFESESELDLSESESEPDFFESSESKDFKIPGKQLLTSIISYVEEDMKRVDQFESLLSTVNLKKFEKDDLKKIGKKSKDKWLSKNTTWLNVIVSKNSDDEGSDSEKSSGSDSDKSSGSDSDKSSGSESEEEEEEEGGSLPTFDKKLSSTTFSFPKKKIEEQNIILQDGKVQQLQKNK